MPKRQSQVGRGCKTNHNIWWSAMRNESCEKLQNSRYLQQIKAIKITDISNKKQLSGIT